MTRQVHLDRLSTLSDTSLAAVVEVVEQALMLGNGFLARQENGDLRAMDTTKVVIHER